MMGNDPSKNNYCCANSATAKNSQPGRGMSFVSVIADSNYKQLNSVL